jgi:putative ABC transport system permease protein
MVLVNIQTGLLLGLLRKGSLFVDHAGAHLWVAHRGVENVEFGAEIPEIWIQRIRGLAGVAEAEPCILHQATASIPNGDYESVWIVGAEPNSTLARPWNLTRGTLRDLDRPDAISMEELEFWKFGNPTLGDVIEISGRRARIVATTRGIQSFTSFPYLFTNLDAARAYGRIRDGFCTYLLVRAREGNDLGVLAEQIRSLIPHADVFTTEQFSRKSRLHWLARTGIGVSFAGATILGSFVGLLMVSQSLYALTLDHVSDYATLKAIGADERHIFGIVVSQSLSVWLVGSLIGLAATLAMRAAIETPMAQIDLPSWLLASSIAMDCVICVAAAVLPFARLLRVDPVTVLQA